MTLIAVAIIFSPIFIDSSAKICFFRNYRVMMALNLTKAGELNM